MPDARPVHRTVSSSRFRAELAETLALTDARVRVLVERRGRKPVVLISLDDLQKLELFEREQAARGGAL
jgi:PHD/YefM family antitoxin component YafN of YafNO toxin-antitoxin module